MPALASALEVLAANGVDVMIAEKDEYTPTPAVSHAILSYSRKRKTGLADGIIITPSHNPPHDGGFKYNPPNGGPDAAAKTMPRCKGHEHDNEHLAIRETCGIAKTGDSTLWNTTKISPRLLNRSRPRTRWPRRHTPFI